MKVDDELVDRIAVLSKLKFEGAVKEAIKKDLQKMLSFVEKLNEIDTSNIAPLRFMTDEVNHIREDVAKLQITQAQALQNAPDKDSDYFKVPKVIDNTEK